jgi:hypothetical protein
MMRVLLAISMLLGASSAFAGTYQGVNLKGQPCTIVLNISKNGEYAQVQVGTGSRYIGGVAKKLSYNTYSLDYNGASIDFTTFSDDLVTKGTIRTTVLTNSVFFNKSQFTCMSNK